MREIVAADQPFVRSEVSTDEALEVFADQPYKREIIERVRPPATMPRQRTPSTSVRRLPVAR